jgi:4-aminobutyrate aminotransferase-like enzyme
MSHKFFGDEGTGAQGATLKRGDLLPCIRVTPPGPMSLEMARTLAQVEAPKVNTVGNAGEPSLCWDDACGANVADLDGNIFIDLTSGFGVASIGHRNPEVVAAVGRQSGRLLHGLGDVHPHPLRAELAARLCALVPVDDARVYFAVSGSDAVEIALKSALLATRRSTLVAFDRGYHGLTLGALAVTARDAFRRPFQEHLHAHVRRVGYACGESEIEAALAGDDVAAVLVEPATGREGVIFPPRGWLGMLSAACRRHGTMLIVDEIFTGFGRTGYRFAVEADEVRPDLLCCGKALGGGVPIAAAIGRREVMEAWNRPGEALHTATFIANPLSCAAGLAALDFMEREQLAARAAALGEHVGQRLRAWAAQISAGATASPIKDIRGRGLMWAVEVSDRAVSSRWSQEALRRGVIALGGRSSLYIEPPLTITMEQLDTALDILAVAFDAALASGAEGS